MVRAVLVVILPAGIGRLRVRFINASSAATYGDGSAGFSDSVEIMKNLKPLNMYGYSKHLFDMWALRSNFLNQLASLKFFNVFGPNEYHKGSMCSLFYKGFNQALETGRISGAILFILRIVWI